MCIYYILINILLYSLFYPHEKSLGERRKCAVCNAATPCPRGSRWRSSIHNRQARWGWGWNIPWFSHGFSHGFQFSELANTDILITTYQLQLLVSRTSTCIIIYHHLSSSVINYHHPPLAIYQHLSASIIIYHHIAMENGPPIDDFTFR